MYKKVLITWLLFIPVAIVNGLIREMVYRHWVGELAAHQISTAIAVVAFVLVAYAIMKPVAHKMSSSAKLATGVMWVVMTVLFEFLFGHYIDKISWQKLLADYNISQGRVWGIFLLAEFVTPFIISAPRKLFLSFFAFIYTHIVKKIFFTIPPERMHNNMTTFGEVLGNSAISKRLLAQLFVAKYPSLSQTVKGVHFPSPVGLAAGFDYEARLTQILASVGFGFQTVGTITHMPYEGNPRPMLGRLPRSRSLMVNKGFKNRGAEAVVTKLAGLSFPIPVGISIGRTNTKDLKTQKESVEDILAAFTIFEKSEVKHAYYELNISCPNLYGNITFYPPHNLKQLLKEVDSLHLRRPLFIKMPIEKSDAEVLQMLEVIQHHSVDGVIIGNLQKNRQDPALVPSEVSQFSVGAFSGKPTYNRSNELISLCYTYYGKHLTIIGCGGVFSGEDAYTKIRRGASLIQLITGMIFQGPQLIAQVNMELDTCLKRDGLKHISEAVGSHRS